MTVIIDSSALVAVLLKESRFEELSEMVARGASSHVQLITESSNAILQANKDGRVDEEGARNLVETMLGLIRSSSITLHGEEELVQDALRISLDHDLTIYDSVFLALAQKLHGSLASRDKKQIEAAQKLGIAVLDT